MACNEFHFLPSNDITPHVTAIIERLSQEKDGILGLITKNYNISIKLICFLYCLKYFKSDKCLSLLTIYRGSILSGCDNAV